MATEAAVVAIEALLCDLQGAVLGSTAMLATASHTFQCHSVACLSRAVCLWKMSRGRRNIGKMKKNKENRKNKMKKKTMKKMKKMKKMRGGCQAVLETHHIRCMHFIAESSCHTRF